MCHLQLYILIALTEIVTSTLLFIWSITVIFIVRSQITGLISTLDGILKQYQIVIAPVRRHQVIVFGAYLTTVLMRPPLAETRLLTPISGIEHQAGW
jgi:hypothetical protein